MTPTNMRPHKPMLAEWNSEIFSLSHILNGRAGITGWQAEDWQLVVS